MQDLHLQKEFLIEQIEGRHQILNALSNFSQLFKKLEDQMKEKGTYFEMNSGHFTNALEGMDWADQIGTPQGTHQELKRLHGILNASRQQALDLLGRCQKEVEAGPLSLSQFLVPRALA